MERFGLWVERCSVAVSVRRTARPVDMGSYGLPCVRQIGDSAQT
jgi:hypothetical protein